MVPFSAGTKAVDDLVTDAPRRLDEPTRRSRAPREGNSPSRRQGRRTIRRTATLTVFRLAFAVVLMVSSVCAGCAPNTPNTPNAPKTEAKGYEPALVHAAPNLQCKLYPQGGSAAQGIPVDTDDDGYARFFAVRGASKLTLDCKDSAGKTSTYAVDPTAAETFVSHPVNLAQQRGIDRPALKGDPQSYTQDQLIQQGYGLRPDRDKDPAAYARWLAAASKPARMLLAVKPDLHSHTVTSQQSPWWVGSVLNGAADYNYTEAQFNVPGAVPGGDGTTTTEVALWNGLGGFGTGSGLIQGGVNLYTTNSAAAYGTWREYCCGDPDSNGYGGAFTPNPGDQIYSEEWYCNAQGGIDINGGYGCTYLEDVTTGALLNCTLSTGKPCWSVKASPGMTLGKAAEFIIENQSPQVSKSSTAFTDFTPQVTMSGSGSSTKTGTNQSVSTDPSVSLLTDFTKTTSHIVVRLSAPDNTIFSMEPAQPSYPLYCQGPLTTSAGLSPSTSYKWASKGAGAAAPGPGECAWADRGPRPIEIKPGNSNNIDGFLNEIANLPKGKYGEVGVYRDSNFANDMVVTQIVGFVNPPFSGKPALP
jgi:hypothetical protein